MGYEKNKYRAYPISLPSFNISVADPKMETGKRWMSKDSNSSSHFGQKALL